MKEIGAKYAIFVFLNSIFFGHNQNEWGFLSQVGLIWHLKLDVRIGSEPLSRIQLRLALPLPLPEDEDYDADNDVWWWCWFSQINHLLTTSPSPFPLSPVQSAQKPDLRAAASFAQINNSREQSRRKWSRLDVGSERRTFGKRAGVRVLS